MMFIDQIVDHIIRPLRQKYRMSRLGPTDFTIISKQGNVQRIQRQDHTLLSNKNLKIELSCYEIKDKQKLPYVVYLHANNGSRTQGMTYLKTLLENQFNVALFDCTGSGNSEGEYVSLGHQESRDLDVVVNFLVQNKSASSICLWGRSMGAVTALLYAGRARKQICCGVYDSPFRSLKKIIKQLASAKTGLPQFFFNPVMMMIDARIRDKCGWGLQDLKVKDCVEGIQVPGMFITSKNDTMVSAQHTEKLFNLYGGPKEIRYISTAHHQNRPDDLIAEIVGFMKRNAVKKAHESSGVRRLHTIFMMGGSQVHTPQNSNLRQKIMNSLPSKVLSKPGKVSISNLKKMIDDQMMTNRSGLDSRHRFDYSTPSTIRSNRQITSDSATKEQNKYSELLSKNLVIQQHNRIPSHQQLHSKGIKLVSRNAEQ